MELAVKHWGEFAQFVKDRQDRYALVLCSLAYFGQSATRRGIDSGHWFVHDQELGLSDQRARNEYALLLSAGKNVEGILRAMCEADGTQCFQRLCSVTAGVPPLASAQEPGKNDFDA